MTFLDRWQDQLNDSFAVFAEVAPASKEINFTYGLLATAVLWPIRQPVQDFHGEAIGAINEIAGIAAKQILQLMQGWGDDPLTTAREMATQAEANSDLQNALENLIERFGARSGFVAHLIQALGGSADQTATIQITGGSDSTVNVGNVISGIVSGDVVGGDKVSGDKVLGDKVVYIQVGSADPPEDKTPPQWFEPETILIPAGPFLMGSDDGEPHEVGQNEINLSDYEIGKYPVTNEQYAEFIRQTDRTAAPESGWDGQNPPPDKLRHPVMGVTWYDALAYCQWLSEVTGRRYRLPSEAHWEKAARGTDGRVYPWGDEWEVGRSNYGNNQPTPVDAYPPQSIYECYDMVGNVRQWTSTLWGKNRQQPDEKFRYPWADDGREDVSATRKIYRVYRGGTAADKQEQLRCCARNAFLPSKLGPPGKRHGFRVMLIG